VQLDFLFSLMHAGLGTQLSTYRLPQRSSCSAVACSKGSSLIAAASSSKHAWLVQDKRLCDAVLVLVPAKGKPYIVWLDMVTLQALQLP
jgi:hypothetical protein